MAKKKKKTVSKLKRELDAVFSKFIRLRKAVQIGDVFYCTCVTCGKEAPVSKMQNGHFMSRRFTNTRFYEKNCNVQCVGCNRFDQGRQYEHHLYIEKEYGSGASETLHKLSRVSKTFKVNELEMMIEEYSEKVKELDNII